MICIQAGQVVRTIARPAKEFIGLRNVYDKDKPYSVSKAIAKLHESGRGLGITKSAQAVLAAVYAADDSLLIDHTPFKDEEGKTMLNDEDTDDNNENNETTEVVAPKRRLPPPKAKIPPSKKPAPVSKTESETTTTKPKKETTMAAKKTPAKKTKTVAKKSAPAKKTPAAAGEGGFRAGSNMEKGFIAYKADRVKYQKFERGDKQAWAQKLADKLDTTLNSVRTMISKNWEPLLAK